MRLALSITCLTAVFACFRLFGAELTLKDAIRLAVKNHPQASADKFREVASEQEISRARAAYYPQISAMAVETSGFPGSSSAIGIGGIVGSPYRKGPGAGVLLEQELFDFGRTSASVTVAQKQSALSKTESKVNSIQIGSQAIELFAACARDRSLSEIYHDLWNEAKVVQKEVAMFVSTGQRSIVDRYLSESQTEETSTIAADFKERVNQDQTRLLTHLGLSEQSAGCPLLTEEMSQQMVSPNATQQESSPLVRRAENEWEIAQAQTDRSRKDYYPRLVGLASVGYLDSTQLGVPIQNYAVAIGLVVPLFEGFKTDSEVENRLAASQQKEQELNATKLYLNETNLAFDEEIGSASLKIDRLHHEKELAETAFRTAKQRYLAGNGTLVDLRESLRNISRIRTEQKDAQARLLVKSSEKALLNGPLLEELSK